jgi:hypothetical protein
MRTFAIWLFGLLASALVGGLLGTLFDKGPYDNNWFWGFLAGMFAFTFLRLWLAGSKNLK